MASNFKGVFIPAHILRNKNLTRTEEHLYCYILNFPDGCFASDKYIAETLGVGERTVSNALSSLRKRGLIYSNGDKRKLFANEITDDDFPKSGSHTSRTREATLPELGKPHFPNW